MIAVTPGCLAKGSSGAPLPRRDNLPVCCADAQVADRLDGQTVLVEGEYRPILVTAQGKKVRALEERGERPGTVEIRTDWGAGVVLGIYYRAESVRAGSEVETMTGRRVRARGVLHRHTPPQAVIAGAPTMAGPYLDPVERVDLVE